MGMTDLDRLDTLAAAATPGPWTVAHGEHEHRPFDVESGHETMGAFASTGWVLASIHEPWHRGVNGPPRVTNARNNAAYIAAVSPDVVQSLVARVRAAEAVVEEARLVGQWHDERHLTEDISVAMGTGVEYAQPRPTIDESDTDDPCDSPRYHTRQAERILAALSAPEAPHE